MAESQPQRWSYARRAGILLGALALLGLVAWGWLAGLPRLKQSPAYLKFTIKQYLRKHAPKDAPPVKFDSNIRQTLAKMRADLAAFQADLARRETNLALLQQKMASEGKESLDHQDQARGLRQWVASLRKELPARQRELAAKEASATNQTAYFISAVRQKLAGCSTYGAMHQLIRIELEAAEPLLAANDLAAKRDGFLLAAEAARHSGAYAENYWLASRIAEAYLLPNLHLADAPDGGRAQTLQVLQFCSDMFAQTLDTNLYLQSTRLQLKHAPSPQKADAMRYAMALELESMELKHAALLYLREITDPDLTYTAKRRIIRIEKELPARADPKATTKPAPPPPGKK